MVTREFPPIGMSPAVWGPIFWNAMHIVTLGYPHLPTTQEKSAVVAYFNSLQYVIPCPVCRDHYSHFLKETPVPADSRDELIEWLFELHNKVNGQLGKPTISWEAFIAHTNNLQSSAPTTTVMTAATYFALGLIVGGGGYFLYQKYK